MDGVNEYKWNGPSIVNLSKAYFIGVLDFKTAGGFSEASAAIALVTSAVGANALGAAWYKPDASLGGFSNGCGSVGAIGVGETGLITSSTAGSYSATVNPSCGEATFTLNPGDSFGIWAKLFTFHAVDGYTDASNTFSVALSPDVPEATRALLESNLVLIDRKFTASVPEPASWR